MYFDVDYYWRVIRYVWKLKGWPKRRQLLFRLLVITPPLTLFHSLCFVLDYLLFPRLWRQPVTTPVFIVGHARSGTTLMHRLMSADGERFSYFLYWETFFPHCYRKKLFAGWASSTRCLAARCLKGCKPGMTRLSAPSAICTI